MFRLVHAVIAGLVGAAFLHLLIVLLLPIVVGGRSHASLNSLASATGEPFVLSAEAARQAGFVGIDPAFATRICPFDLSSGSFRVQSVGKVPFFSIAVLDEADTIAFSIVDRLSFSRAIDLEIFHRSEERRYRLRADTGLNENANTLPVFMEAFRGVVLVRAFQPDDSHALQVERFLKGLRCESLDAAAQ
jgi:uncharacterized membrane protein